MMLVCDICGDRSLDVHAGLVHWIDPAQPYSNVDRCSDRDACKLRVLASGEDWPVADPIHRPKSQTQ